MKHPKSFESTPETRKRMANVKLKNGKAEQLLAKRLWHSGLRYRKNYKKLPGSPDIAITSSHIAIFVDGEFWHGFEWESRKMRLKSNREYWIEKIEENIRRDQKNDLLLESSGWRVFHFWEKQVLKDVEMCAETVINAVREKKDDVTTDTAKLMESEANECGH